MGNRYICRHSQTFVGPGLTSPGGPIGKSRPVPEEISCSRQKKQEINRTTNARITGVPYQCVSVRVAKLINHSYITLLPSSVMTIYQEFR